MYDVVFVADIYVPGGTNFQLAQNIHYLWSAGKRIGIVPVKLPHAKGRKAINRFVREAMSSGQCEVVDQALSVVRARHLIIDNPRLMVPDMSIKVRVAAGRIVVQVPFPPQDGDGLSTFDPTETQHTINRFAEGEVIWAPVSNLVREQLRRLHPHLLLSENNAHPIVDSAAYRFSADLNDRRRFLIGRHSRPEPDKWPATRGQFLKVYPSTAPFDVSLLGIDTASLAAIIGEVPKNCRVLPYDSVPVADFLESIDFFVYYHHKSWIEAFGIATAEAMASGVPCILPPYMEVNFGDAAIYAAPNEVRDVVARLHSTPRKYKERARFASNFVRQQFSGANIANFMDEIGVAASRAKSGRAPRPRKIDAVYVADFSSPKVFNHAFVDELTEAAARGEKVAACDMRGETLGQIHAASHAFDGHAIRLVEIDETIVCKELVINDPWRLIANSVDLGRFHPERTTCLVSYPHGDVATMQRYFARHQQFQPAAVAWAPRDAQSRMWLESFDPNLVLSPTNRAATVSADAAARLSEFRRQRPITVRRTIGFAGVENEEDARWIEHIMPVIEGEPTPTLTCFGDRPASVPLDPRIVCSGYRGIDLVKWVAKLDRLVVLRDRMKADNLDYMIALCRVTEIPVYYRWRNNKERASGAPTLEGLDKAALKRLLVGESAPAIAATMKEARAKPNGKKANGHKTNGHKLKLNGHQLNGHMALNGNAHPVLNGATRKPRKGGAKETLLFVSQNGTGVGHVVRLLSIARRLADRYDCLFLTMSQAVPFISAFGFHAEYFPSAVYSGVSYTDWIHWLRLKVDLMIDAWNIRAIVFDGNVPYAAVAEAAAARPDVSSVWIRRGMWPDSEEDRKRLRTQTYFNMVIEPRDFAEELDIGPTRPLRDTVRLVPPIHLLDDAEIMSRSEACATLGLDTDATNVLVQLGSGNNRDTQSVISRIERTIGSMRRVQIYNLRWPISDMPPIPLPNVHDLAVFPVARFYAAFDFSVAAAGYNTAHEVLNHRLPTLFVPNTTEGMDNQRGRADFSAALGLSLSASTGTLATDLHKMMDEDFRKGMRTRLRRLSVKNGAAQAAALVDELAHGAA